MPIYRLASCNKRVAHFWSWILQVTSDQHMHVRLLWPEVFWLSVQQIMSESRSYSSRMPQPTCVAVARDTYSPATFMQLLLASARSAEGLGHSSVSRTINQRGVFYERLKVSSSRTFASPWCLEPACQQLVHQWDHSRGSYRLGPES
jgi:hypothetical protein